jgi:hypothetical protein
MSATEKTTAEKVEAYLQKFHDYLQGLSDTKVTKAMQLWLRCDHAYKMVVLQATGFDTRMLTCPCAAKHLREHFDTMDLTDELDSCIEDMESDIRSAARTDA